MKFKQNFLLNYLSETPTPLAVERWFECEILSQQEFKRPILDLGCGEGIFASRLFDEQIDVGVEPNQLELERAKSYGIYNELIACFGDKIPKEDGSFNTIFSNSVLEHIPDLDAVLREVHRLLTDTGRFYATVPTDLFDKYTIIYVILSRLGLSGLAERYRRFFNRFWKHYHYYNKDEWIKLFEKHGLKVIASQEYCPKSICILNDLMAPFSILSFVSKKLFNRWILFSALRRAYVKVISSAIQPFLSIDHQLKNGGIIFFALKKD